MVVVQQRSSCLTSKAKASTSIAIIRKDYKKKKEGLIPDLGVIQAHLLRPSEKKQSPPAFSSLSSVRFLLSALEVFEPLRRRALFPLEVEAILNGDDSHEEDASEEYDAFMETPFRLRIEGLRGGELFFFAVKVTSFVLSVFFTGLLLPAGTRTERNSRSEEESTDRTLDGADIIVLTFRLF